MQGMTDSGTRVRTRAWLFLCCVSVFYSIGGCRAKEPGVASPAPPATVPARTTSSALTVPVYPGKIVIELRGVVALLNPAAPEGEVVHALIPRDRSARTARDNPAVSIPAHQAFIRFPMAGGYQSNSPRKILRFTHEESAVEYGYVLLDGEEVFIDGGAAKVSGVSLYDQFTIEPAPSYPNAALKNAFHWVPKMSRICENTRYQPASSATVAKLITIDRGLLRSIEPAQEWEFEPEGDGLPTYTTAVAQGVRWELEPRADLTKFSIRTGNNPDALNFAVGGAAVEIGNYSLDDILMKKHHNPAVGQKDHHFELYYKFLVGEHPGAFHVPKLVKTFGAVSHLTSGGPSCGPGHLP